MRRKPSPAWLLATCLTAATISAQVPARGAAAKKGGGQKSGGQTATRAAAPARQSAEQATAARWMRSMTLREKIAQLFVIGFNGTPLPTGSNEYRRLQRLVAEEHVGGLILVNVSNGRTIAKADPLEAASFINRMQRQAKVPLLVAGDFERGASMRVDASTIFPHAMAFTASRDPEEARVEGRITAREARAMGVHWLFFPDADVNNNPDNPIINIRSYGENPADVSAFVSAFIEGAHSVPEARVLTTAKHFPGHGDTSVDTHMNLATITGDRQRLEGVEWTPFRAAIASGTDAIMTAHIAVPALDDLGVPATLSPKIITGILRTEFGFKGIIVTDALEMGGITKGYPDGEASVRALLAGADVLLMPSDATSAIKAVEAALQNGRVTQKRVDESAMRILTAKARLGLAKKKTVELEEIHSVLNTEESAAAAQKISDRSFTLVRNEGNFLPLKNPGTTAFFLLTEGRASVQGLAFAAELKKRTRNAQVFTLDSIMSEADLSSALKEASAATHYVAVAFASVAAYSGSVALGGGFPQLIQSLVETGKPVGLMALGNPYLLRNFPQVAAFATTYSSVPLAEVSTVKALFGEMTVGGKLPVTIPGFAAYGAGLSVPAGSK